MRLAALLLVLASSCATEKPLEWYPRVTVWKDRLTCAESDFANSERIGIKEADLCRLGSGVLLSIGAKI
jgi:hypothetical protein